MRKIIYIALMLILSLSGAACTTEGQEVMEPSHEALKLTYPADVAIFGDYILVADCAYAADETPLPYKEGRLAVIDRTTHKLKHILKTSALNPQWITVVGDKAYIVSSGAIDYDMKTYFSFAASDGAVDVLNLADVSKWAASLPLPASADKTKGAFGRLAVTKDGKIGYMGSGITNGTFELDLENMTIVHGATDPLFILEDTVGENGMTSIKIFNNKAYIAAFNNDAVCVADTVSDHLKDADCQVIGVEPNILEGPIDIALDYNDHDLIVGMSIANALYFVKYDSDHASFETGQIGKAGAGVNAVIKNGKYLYAVNSMGGSITRRHLPTNETVPSWAVMPPGSNPVQLAVDNEKKLIYVSLAASGNVALVNLESGEVTGYLEK